MSNGLNLNSIMNIAAIVGSVFTGGSSLMLMAATQAVGQLGSQALSGALQSLGVNSGLTNVLVNAFEAGFAAVTGNYGQASQEVMEMASAIVDSANNQGPGGSYSGDLDRAMADVQDSMMQIMTQTVQDSDEASGDGAADSWLVALAKAMGEQMGKQLNKMVELSDQMAHLDAKDDAEKFASVNSEFAAQSQMFSILSNTFNTAIKAIGEGLAGMARKQ